MGGAGDSPAPVGDPPTGTRESKVANEAFPLARSVVPFPSGASPDGTGGSPVLPRTNFSDTLSGNFETGFRDGDVLKFGVNLGLIGIQTAGHSDLVNLFSDPGAGQCHKHNDHFGNEDCQRSARPVPWRAAQTGCGGHSEKAQNDLPFALSNSIERLEPK
jgi:hypothetical protein